MSVALEQLVRETMEITGAPLPAMMEKDAPVLDPGAISVGEDEFYLVGLIGGKEVGKSALVNALVGEKVTLSTSYGPGTEMAIAYAHQSQASAVGELLGKIVPGKFRVVSHGVAELGRLVLLDLPDIDSHYQDHLATTRAVLRQLLFPVWVGSVEKYADAQPMKLLAQVAAGNAPENFVFCLNKGDQVVSAASKPPEDRSAESASKMLQEIGDDYARRIGRVLELASPPRVFVISAISPGEFDLPELKKLLMRERETSVVKESKELAHRRQERSLLGWLGTQQLPARVQRLARLREEAEDLLATRLGPSLLDDVAMKLGNDPLTISAITDEVLDERVSHWPIVNLVHTLFSPMLLLARGMLARQAVAPGNPQSLVDASLRDVGEPIAVQLQSAFGQLRRAQPMVGDLYQSNPLWESGPADAAVRELSRRLSQTLVRRQDAIRRRFTSPTALLGLPFRWLLTIGAVFWFPFIQPILSTVLVSHISVTKLATVGLLVQVLGVDYLLKSVVFLLIWFLCLWLALRWNTQRKVARLVGKFAAAGPKADVEMNLTAQAIAWLDELLEPLREAETRMASLARRVEDLSGATRRAG